MVVDDQDPRAHVRMLAVAFPTRIVASLKAAEAKARAGTEVDLLPTPFRRNSPPPSVEEANSRGGTMKGKPTHGASTLVLLGVLAAVGIGALVSAAQATAPGKNGEIAFKRYLDSGRSTGAIFAVDANGKGERQITKPESGVVDDQPDWSSDGSLLVFHRSVPDSPTAIYTVKPDGSDLARLSPPCSASGPDIETKCEDGAWPSFLPTGSVSSTRGPREGPAVPRRGTVDPALRHRREGRGRGQPAGADPLPPLRGRLRHGPLLA